LRPLRLPDASLRDRNDDVEAAHIKEDVGKLRR